MYYLMSAADILLPVLAYHVQLDFHLLSHQFAVERLILVLVQEGVSRLAVGLEGITATKPTMDRTGTTAAASLNLASALGPGKKIYDRGRTPVVKGEIEAEINQDSTDNHVDAPTPPRSLRAQQSRPSSPTPSRPNTDIFKQFAIFSAAKQTSHRASSSATRSSDFPPRRSRTRCARITGRYDNW
ncbi:hypothetical protein M438DRAFT_17354 [Aureobasidium pullulans EXF-150]|uniref:Uncharacterized protein n=1 Tax=Aureobasidium pullulans EXF-150 TaxID=1043002 RepID=A0A074XWH9_AURPU|nr:uncharacterized protein M438DRAFT_17354 [Aureobasidium pullulans EXF-150]KEQ89953.1 hypothetical protein M438DRAFT_17354 [Aureobasidium pullulans EXF-150]